MNSFYFESTDGIMEAEVHNWNPWGESLTHTWYGRMTLKDSDEMEAFFTTSTLEEFIEMLRDDQARTWQFAD